MSDKKYVVPDGMFKAAFLALEFKPDDLDDVCDEWYARTALEAALRWLSENPIVPTDAQWEAMRDWDSTKSGFDTFFRHVLAEWQRRMFLAPEPEIPPEIEDLLWRGKIITPGDETITENDRRITEAFNRGRRLGERE